MLVTLKEILAIATEQKNAVGSFNTPNLASINAVIGAAEDLNQPVIIMHAQVHEEMGICKMSEITPIMLLLAKRAKVPVCVHLDHGTDVEYVEAGIKEGFTSVMYDGSVLPDTENIANTLKAVELAKATGASVEAEIGSMGAREGSAEGGGSIYTEPDAAKSFVETTNVDALACAFGTAHGFYATKPKLDFERLSKIDSLVNVPIVMHGGSGVSTDDYREVIKHGVRKINYYTYMSAAGGKAISGKQFDQFHTAVMQAEAAMRENVKFAITVFAGLDK